jgi:hypothetical protein
MDADVHKFGARITAADVRWAKISPRVEKT